MSVSGMSLKPGALRQHASLLQALARALDLAAVAAATQVASRYTEVGGTETPTRQLATIVGVLLAASIFPALGLYEPWRGRPLLSELRAVGVACLSVLAGLILTAYLTGSLTFFPPDWWATWLGTGLLILVLVRVALRSALAGIRQRGFNRRFVVLAGAGMLGRDVARRIAEASWTGYHVGGFFDDDAPPASSIGDIPVLGRLADLAPYVAGHQVDEVWITLPLPQYARTEEVLHALRHVTANVRFAPDIAGLRLVGRSLTEVAGIPLVNLTVSPIVGLNRVLKAVEDYLLAGLLLVLVGPLMLLIALGVKLSSPGPVFYRQERLSQNGQRFQMLKFRSMPIDAEAHTGPVWAKAGECRATPFGAFLRRTSLDELPQLLNILAGHMSLVGPRPERPVFVDRFKDEIPGYMQKHLVKAGITGWAQVNGWRGHTCLRTRLEHDLYYIENWSIWLDIKIIALTFFKGLVHRNAY